MALHGGDDHALGQTEEALVELGAEDERPLDHVDDLLELAERVLPVTECVKRLDDETAALGGVRLDVRGAQRRSVRPGGRDVDLAVREAMAEGRAGAGQRLFVELLAEPPHGTRETVPAVVPAHRLAELEPVDDRPHPREQRLSAERFPGHAGPADARRAPRDRSRRARSAWRSRPPPAHGAPPAAPSRAARPPSRAARRRRTRSAAGSRRRGMPRRPAGSDEHRQLRLGLTARRGRQLLAAELKQQRRHRASPRRDGLLSA